MLQRDHLTVITDPVWAIAGTISANVDGILCGYAIKKKDEIEKVAKANR